MPATTTRRRDRSTSKSDQDKAQREAAAAARKQPDTPELAAAGAPVEGEQPNGQPESASDATSAEPAEFEVGAVVTLPTIKRKSSKPSVWTDRLNDAAEKLETAGFPDSGAVAILVCATPRTAANTASGLRVRIKNNSINGLREGMYGPGGKLQLVTRGRTILIATNPPGASPKESEARASRK